MSNIDQHDPQTPEEWQWAIDMGRALELIDAAQQYGLVTGGPAVKHDRVAELTERAAKLGIVPHDDKYCIDMYLSENDNTPPRLAPGYRNPQLGRFGAG